MLWPAQNPGPKGSSLFGAKCQLQRPGSWQDDHHTLRGCHRATANGGAAPVR